MVGGALEPLHRDLQIGRNAAAFRVAHPDLEFGGRVAGGSGGTQRRASNSLRKRVRRLRCGWRAGVAMVMGPGMDPVVSAVGVGAIRAGVGMGATSGSAAVCLAGASGRVVQRRQPALRVLPAQPAPRPCAAAAAAAICPEVGAGPFCAAVATEHADHLNCAVQDQQQAHAYHQGAAAIGEEAADQARRCLLARAFFAARTFDRAAFTRCGLCGAPRGGNEIRFAGNFRGRLALDRGECGFRGGNALGG